MSDLNTMSAWKVNGTVWDAMSRMGWIASGGVKSDPDRKMLDQVRKVGDAIFRNDRMDLEREAEVLDRMVTDHVAVCVGTDDALKLRAMSRSLDTLYRDMIRVI